MLAFTRWVLLRTTKKLASNKSVCLLQVVARNPLGQVTADVMVVLGDISTSPESPVVEAMTDTGMHTCPVCMKGRILCKVLHFALLKGRILL